MLGNEANYANVFDYAQQQAEKGDKYALTILGLIYHGLEDIKTDRDLEFELYQKAAKLDEILINLNYQNLESDYGDYSNEPCTDCAE